MQDTRMGLKTATEGSVILSNEVSGLVITSLYWIKIRAVRWKVSDQSSCRAVRWKVSDQSSCRAVRWKVSDQSSCWVVRWKVSDQSSCRAVRWKVSDQSSCRTVRWKVSDQSSCTIYNFFHFWNTIKCMAFSFSTKLKDASCSWNLPQAIFIEKNGAIISLVVTRCTLVI